MTKRFTSRAGFIAIFRKSLKVVVTGYALQLYKVPPKYLNTFRWTLIDPQEIFVGIRIKPAPSRRDKRRERKRRGKR